MCSSTCRHSSLLLLREHDVYGNVYQYSDAVCMHGWCSSTVRSPAVQHRSQKREVPTTESSVVRSSLLVWTQHIHMIINVIFTRVTVIRGGSVGDCIECEAGRPGGRPATLSAQAAQPTKSTQSLGLSKHYHKWHCHLRYTGVHYRTSQPAACS